MDGFNGAAAGASLQPKEEEAESGKKERSVLQAKLTRLAIQIGYAGSFVAACTVLILVIRFVISRYVIEGQPFSLADFQVRKRLFLAYAPLMQRKSFAVFCQFSYYRCHGARRRRARRLAACGHAFARLLGQEDDAR